MGSFSQPRVHTFAASFDGECDTCCGEIYEGDQIAYLPGETGVSCEECIGQHEEE